MIDRIGSETNFSNVSNAARVRSGEISPGFGELLTEKTVSMQTVRHGFVGDGQVLCPELPIAIINALMSLTDDLEDVWEILLRLEKRVDIEVLSENIVKEPDNIAGWNSAAALLTQFWKKKELSGNYAPENSVDIAAYFNQNHIKNRAASELEALIHKNKERKLITAVNSGL